MQLPTLCSLSLTGKANKFLQVCNTCFGLHVLPLRSIVESLSTKLFGKPKSVKDLSKLISQRNQTVSIWALTKIIRIGFKNY